MNNKQNNNNRKLLDTQRSNSDAGYNNFVSGIDLTGSRNRANGLRDTIQARYTDNNNFMPDGIKPNAGGWFDLPKDSAGSGHAGADYSSAKTGYQNFADTGGTYDRSGYQDFANTGGVDATALRNRATAVIPSFYKAYADSAKRRANVQGGYSPGFDAQQAEIGRQQGREGFNASRQVEGDIADKTQTGRMFGITGLSDIDSRQNTNKLAGLGGLKGISDSEQQNSQFNAGLDESRNSRNSALQLALAKMYQEGGITSARGLQDLRSSSDGDLEQDYSAYLRGSGQRDQNFMNNMGLRSSIRNNSWMDLIAPIAGLGSAGLGAYARPGRNTGINGGRPPSTEGFY